MTVLAMAAATGRRIIRDRLSLFLLLVLPILVILIVGTVVGSQDRLRVGVVVEGKGALTSQVVAELDAAHELRVRHIADSQTARTALRRGEILTAIVLPPDFDATIRNGDQVTVSVFADRNSTYQQAAASEVEGVVAVVAARFQAALFATGHVGGTLDANLDTAAKAARSSSFIAVQSIAVDARRDYLPAGFGYSAPTMLVLFVFISSIAAGAAMIRSRMLGIYDRMLAAPVRARAIVLGEALVYLGIALAQSLLIVVTGGLFFGVSWGDPIAAALLVVVWALVGTGAGMLSGTLFRTPEQAVSIGPPVGIALGMLGGCMWPLEIVPRFMRLLGHFVPHAWAVDAWTTLLSRDGAVRDIGGSLAVLAAFGASLLLLATVRLHARLVR